MVRLKKHLGQHLLHDRTALAAIRDALDPNTNDIVVEIGPGTGNLTQQLIIFPAKLIALEKDPDMVAALREKFPEYLKEGRLDIIEADALEFNPSVLNVYLHESRTGDTKKGPDEPFFTYKLVGNIPYNITGALIQHFLSADTQPETAVLLMQREVAERILARDKKHSILSVSVHIYGTPRIVRRVPAGAFTPPPRVDSSVLLIEDISRKNFIDRDHEDLFFHIVKTGFAHPRKFTISNLALFYARETLDAVWAELSLNPKIRSEDVSVSEWLSISKTLYTDAYGNAQ